MFLLYDKYDAFFFVNVFRKRQTACKNLRMDVKSLESSFFMRKKQHYHQLSEAERFLIDYLERHLSEIPEKSIVALSEEASVSTATITRTMQKIGYTGFTAFKIHIKDEISDPDFDVIEKVDNEIKKAILKNEQEVTNTIHQLDSGTIEDAIQKIHFARRIVIFARGFSELIAQEMMVKLQLLGKYAEMHNDPNIIPTISKRYTSKDVVIFISLSGETAELVDAARVCRDKNVGMISFTASRSSSLARLTEIDFVCHKSAVSYFPDYEVRSRLPIQVMARIVLDAYAIRFFES